MRTTRMRQFVKRHPRLYDALNAFRSTHGQLGTWLAEFATSHPQGVNFIQVGASDGLRWDPFRKYILKGKWNGLLVEPLPPVFKLLTRNYRHARNQNLIFVNAVLTSESSDSFTFWSYADSFLNRLNVDQQLYWLRTSSSEKSHILKRLNKYPDAEQKVASYSVPGMTLDEVVAKHWTGDPLNLVLIDAEGHDDEVIYGMDLGSQRPDAILFESHNLPQERKTVLFDHLKSFRYQLRNLGGDTVAELRAAD